VRRGQRRLVCFGVPGHLFVDGRKALRRLSVVRALASVYCRVGITQRAELRRWREWRGRQHDGLLKNFDVRFLHIQIIDVDVVVEHARGIAVDIVGLGVGHQI
jgi:hypothetical protein